MTVTENESLAKPRRWAVPRLEEIALFLFFSGNAIDFFVGVFLTRLNLSGLIPFCKLGIRAVTLAGILVGFSRMDRKLLIGSTVFLLLIASLIGVNYLLNPDIGVWLADDTFGIGRVFGLTGHVFGGGVTGFCVIVCQKDSGKIFRGLKFSNFVLLLYVLLTVRYRVRLGYFAVETENGIRETAYHMGFGYYCIFVATFNYLLWKHEKKIWNLLASIAVTGIAVCFGSRGVLIPLALFIASILWISLKTTKIAARIALVVSIVAIASFCVVFYMDILLGLQELLSSWGVSNSRTISRLISSEFFDPRGRDVLRNLGFSLIRENFPFGVGAFGERVVVGQYFHWGYLHNIVLEIVAEFGLAGVLVLLLLAWKAARLIDCDLDEKWNSLFIMFFSNCGMLWVSNSFWYLPYFWAAIAVGVLYGKEIRQTRFDFRETRIF